MKNSVYEQFATVQEDSATLFDAKLNEKIRELKGFNPKVKFSDSIPFYAHIAYVVNDVTPETLSEASEIEGVRFICAQCPFFRAALTADGEEDRRCKWGDCDHAEMGRTLKTSPACERLYELIREGDVKVCFRD